MLKLNCSCKGRGDFLLMLSLMAVVLWQSSAATVLADVGVDDKNQLLYQGRDIFELSINELREIPVTTTSLFPESSWTAASTVSRVNKEDWQRRGARRTSDAVEHLPGTLVTPFRFGAEAVAVRGFTGSNLPRGISVVLDGVPLNGFSNGSGMVTVPNFDLGALDNIEMTRGPASALYGSDAFHGVLAMQSAAAATDLKQAEAELASNGYYGAAGRSSQEIGNSAQAIVALAASGQSDQELAYLYTDPENGDQQTGHRASQYDSQTGLIKLVSKDNDTCSYRWGFYWNHFKADNFPGPGRSQTPTSSVLANQDWSGSDTNFAMTTAALSRELTHGITAEINGFLWRTDVTQQTKVPRQGDTIGENQVELGDIRQAGNLIFRQADNAWHTQWALALGYDDMRVYQGHLTALAADNSILNDADELYDGRRRHLENVLLEARTRFFHDKLHLLYGGRIDRYSDFGTQHTPRVGIIFEPQPDLAFKLLYSNAFRAPTAFELAGIGNFKGNPDLQPETIDTVELVALRTTKLWQAGITLFQSRWQDGIVRVASSDPNFRLEFNNVEKNNAQGIETSLQFNAERWLLDLSASYVESENETQGVDYGAFPRLIAAAGIGYRMHNGTEIFLNNRVHLDTAEGVSSANFEAPDLPTYWRVDLQISQEITQHLQLTFNARNLLNRDNALPSLFNAENGVPDEAFSLSVGLRSLF